MREKIYRFNTLKKWIPFLFVILTIPSILQWLNYKLGNTTIWWFVETLFLLFTILYSVTYYSVSIFLFSKAKRRIKRFILLARQQKNYFLLIKLSQIWKKTRDVEIYPVKLPIPIIIYILLVIISIFCGIFKATYYWDWKILYSNAMYYLLPLTSLFFYIPENLKQASRQWVKFAMIAFWFLLPIMQLECPAKFLVPFSFFILYWPYYNKKGIIICIFAFIFVFAFGTLGSRSSIIRFIASFTLSLLVLYSQKISKYVLMTITTLLFLIPIIFFSLGISGQFNIFKIGDYIDLDVTVENAYEEGETENLSSDTRTFLYVETIQSAIEHNYLLWGNSMSQGYYSKAFAYADEVKGRGMRYACEVGILNVFINMGIIGVIAYMSIFLYTIVNVFINSRNKSLMILAILLSFRWFFSFIEEFSRYDLNMMFLWIEIAMCNSPYFLKMTDIQFKSWAKNLVSL